MKTVAIIGSNSFLGSRLCKKLCSEYNIIQVYNNNDNNLNKDLPYYTINAFLNEIKHVEYVFFIASIVSYKNDYKTINSIFKTNVKLLQKISETYLEAKIIHASSVSIYGNNANVINENTLPNPINSYAVSKLWAENLVLNHNGGGVNIRFSSIFGEKMKMNTFIPLIILDALNKNKIFLKGKGLRTQNYIYVDDAVEILIKSMKIDNNIGHKTFLGVNDNSYSNFEIAYLIKNNFISTDIVFEGVDNSSNFIYNNTISKKILKLNDSDNFDEKINKTIQWIVKQYS